MEHRHLLKKTNNYGSFLEIQNTSRLNCLKGTIFHHIFFERYVKKLKLKQKENISKYFISLLNEDK